MDETSDWSMRNRKFDLLIITCKQFVGKFELSLITMLFFFLESKRRKVKKCMDIQAMGVVEES